MPRNERVDFFIVGAMRSGTSSLRDALTLHPSINMAPREPMFFSHPAKFEGVAGYHAIFDWTDQYVVRGEKSPTYAVSARAPQNLKDYNPQAKIVWILRDPVRRAISHFQHARFRRPDAISIKEAVENREELERQRAGVAYVFRSEYHKHISSWLEYFPRVQHHIIILEEMLAEPGKELEKLFDFLGAPRHDIELPHSKNKKMAKFVEDMQTDPADVEALQKALADTPRQIELILGRTVPAWKQ